jgi:hypothetical protein
MYKAFYVYISILYIYKYIRGKLTYCKAYTTQGYNREEGFLHVHCQREFDALEPEAS